MIKLPTQYTATPLKETRSIDRLLAKIQELARIDSPSEAVMIEAFDIASKISDLHDEDPIGNHAKTLKAFKALRHIAILRQVVLIRGYRTIP